MQKGYVYLLQGTRGRYYIGSTKNVQERLERHNSGFVYSSKRLGLPLKLVAYCEYASIDLARDMEFRLKRWKNPEKVKAYLKA